MAKVPFVPFEKVKAKVPIDTVLRHLNLPLKKVKGSEYRCPCPVHGGGARGLCVTTDVKDEHGLLGVFKCHASGEPGGDSLGLVAHVRQSRPYAAMIEIAEAYAPELLGKEPKAQTIPATVPEEKPANGVKKEGGERGFYLPAYVSFDHEAVTETMGVSPELAQSLGISYWKRGHHGKRVAFLLRHPDGRNAGCISLPVELVTELLPPPKWL